MKILLLHYELIRSVKRRQKYRVFSDRRHDVLFAYMHIADWLTSIFVWLLEREESKERVRCAKKTIYCFFNRSGKCNVIRKMEREIVAL